MVKRLPEFLRKFTRIRDKWSDVEMENARYDRVLEFWRAVDRRESNVILASLCLFISINGYHKILRRIDVASLHDVYSNVQPLLVSEWLEILIDEKVRFPKTFNYSVQFHNAARLLAVGIGSGDRPVIDHCVGLINDCYEGRRVVTDDTTQDRIFEPGMVKLAGRLYGTPVSPTVAAVDCGVYDAALAAASDTAQFAAALEACSVYHMKRSRSSNRYYEFDCGPYNLFPFEIWALMRLNPDVVVKHPLVSTWGPPKAFTLSDYRDEYVDVIRDVCFTTPPKWPEVPEKYREKPKGWFSWLRS